VFKIKITKTPIKIKDRKIVEIDTKAENLARRNPLNPSEIEYNNPVLN